MRLKFIICISHQLWIAIKLSKDIAFSGPWKQYSLITCVLQFFKSQHISIAMCWWQVDRWLQELQQVLVKLFYALHVLPLGGVEVVRVIWCFFKSSALSVLQEILWLLQGLSTKTVSAGVYFSSLQSCTALRGWWKWMNNVDWRNTVVLRYPLCLGFK